MALRIAVAQAEAAPLDVASNARTARALVERAGGQGARVVLLPELFLCGYELARIAAEPGRAAVAADDARLEPLRGAARSTRCTVVVGAAVPDGERLRNAVLVIGPGGEIAGRYDKQHLWTGERELFAPGDADAVLDVDGVRLALAVCYDAGFPEHARRAARAGAAGYLVAGAFAAGEEERRLAIYCAARSLENTMYLAFSNLVGAAGDVRWCGRSGVFAPDGRAVTVLTRAPGVAVAELDAAEVARARTQIPYLEDARPDPDRQKVLNA